MSDLIKQLETIGQNAQQRYRQQKLDIAQFEKQDNGEQKAMLVAFDEMKAFMVVGNE